MTSFKIQKRGQCPNQKQRIHHTRASREHPGGKKRVEMWRKNKQGNSTGCLMTESVREHKSRAGMGK